MVGNVIFSILRQFIGFWLTFFQDNGNGTYSLDYLPEKAGTYLLDVKMGDKSVKDSPFTIVVEAGEFDPLNFAWEGLELDSEGRRIVVAGNTDSFKVGARDSFGNSLTAGGLPVAGMLRQEQSLFG